MLQIKMINMTRIRIKVKSWIRIRITVKKLDLDPHQNDKPERIRKTVIRIRTTARGGMRV
jgi:hypothetical protein